MVTTPDSGTKLRAAVAMDTLVKLLENLQSSVDKLSRLAAINWRRRDYLENNIADIRSSCRQIIAALKDFFDFSSGAFVNVNRTIVSNANADRGNAGTEGRLVKHLAHLVRPLGDSLRLMMKLQQTLDISGWMVSKLVREGVGNDSLDQFLAVAKQVPQDARQVASFIHGNVILIFPSSLLNSPSASLRVLPANGVGGSPSSQSLSSSPQPPSQINHHPRSVRFADDVHLSTGEIASISGGDSDESANEHKSNGTLTNGLKIDTAAAQNASDSMRQNAFDDYDYVGDPGLAKK